MIDTKANPFDTAEVIEDEIRETAKYCFVLSDDEIDADALYHATGELIKTWDGDGWYEVMVGGHVWGFDDAHYFDERCDLGACIYSATVATLDWDSFDYLNEVWAHKVTDPDDIAELEALWD